MMHGWKVQVNDHEVNFIREGRVGCNTKLDNAHRIRKTTNVNGSGGHHFGGAKEWPVVECHVGFQEGQQALADELAEELTLVLNQFLFRHGM